MINRSASRHYGAMEDMAAAHSEMDLRLPVRPAADLEDFREAEAVPPLRARAERLVQAYFDFIWRSLRRLGVPASQVDDSTQKVFIVATQKMRTTHVENERAFLFAIALRVACEERRTLRRRQEVAYSDAGDEAPDEVLPLDELVEQRRARAILDGIIDAMPFDLRAVFVLYELEEMTAAEIAILLEMPLGTVASRLRRARQSFEGSVARLRARRRGGGHP